MDDATDVRIHNVKDITTKYEQKQEEENVSFNKKLE